MFQGPGQCPEHGVERERLLQTTLVRARNMTKLLRHVSRNRTTPYRWEDASSFDHWLRSASNRVYGYR